MPTPRVRPCGRRTLAFVLSAALSLVASATAQKSPDARFVFGATHIDCSSFYTHSVFPNVARVAGGAGDADSLQFTPGDMVELSGVAGAPAGSEYRILRVDDGSGEASQFDGQHRDLARMGHRIVAIGRLRVLATRGNSALARVESICNPIRVGDFGIPWKPRKAPASVPLPAFSTAQIIPAADLASSGLVVAAANFASEAGPGDEIYLNRGARQGVHPGQAWLIVRTPQSSSEQWLRGTVRGLKEFQYPEPGLNVSKIAASAHLPQIIGQAVVLWAEAGSATAIITNSRSVVYPGDQAIPQP